MTKHRNPLRNKDCSEKRRTKKELIMNALKEKERKKNNSK